MPRLTIKAITPQHLPPSDEYLFAILGAYNKTVNLIERDLESTTKTWNHKPAFRRVQTKGKDLKTTIGTDDKIYGFVEGGTKPHRIPKVGSTYMSFYSGYRAKTRVEVIGSNAGGSFGSRVSAMVVQHPGFPGRKFIMTIRKRREVTMNQEISHAIAKVNRTQK